MLNDPEIYLIEKEKIGEAQMIRIHFNDSKPDIGWKVQPDSIK